MNNNLRLNNHNYTNDNDYNQPIDPISTSVISH